MRVSKANVKSVIEPLVRTLAFHYNEQLTLEMSASETLFGGQFISLTQLIKSKYYVVDFFGFVLCFCSLTTQCHHLGFLRLFQCLFLRFPLSLVLLQHY